MSSFVLKLIAIITMLCDHTGDAIVGHLSLLNIIGRMAFPIFAFQLVVGFLNTSNIEKYAVRLGIFAIISQIPFSILMYIMNSNILTLNIFFTLLLGLLALFVYNKVNNKFLKYLSIFFIILLGELANVDYGGWGVFLILFIYLLCPTFKNVGLLKNNLPIKYFSFIAIYLLLCIIKYINYFTLLSSSTVFALIVFTFLPFIFMLLYNGKKGPSLKYFFYAFYPLHLIILCFINLVIL